MKTLGIIGGMGPEATVKMFEKVIRFTKASKDQEHLEILIHNNNRVPDRTLAILANGKSPIPELLRSATLLEQCGVNLIIVPCMTSHYFLPEVQTKISVPILNAINETAAFIKEALPDIQTIGLIATTGTISTGLFQKAMSDVGLACVVPDASIQEGLVMDAIYGSKGIKAGYIGRENKDKIKNVASVLVEAGAKAILAGCTEIPLVLAKEDIAVALIDPMTVLAQKAISVCGALPIEAC